MVETVIEAIRINVVTEQHVIILKEVGGSRVVPIWVDPYQAQSIALELQGSEISRPMTHDLMRSIIGEMGGTVERIIVNDLRDNVFYALIYIAMDGRQLEIDSRPSDAVALAVRTHAPIFVEDHVMDQAGFPLHTEAEKPEEEGGAAESEPVDNERLSVFRDFINSLDLDEPQDKE